VTAAVREVRRQQRLPRRAAVILWGLPDNASPLEPSTRAAVRPILDAGFKIDRVLTPPQALACLAATRPRPDGDGAVAWLALNRHGAAIAIVHGGELLFGRSFDWIYQPSLASSRAQLLQRYSLVAHLAPEIQRGMAAVRASHGVRVDTAVTCGDLPELRSLTMPLIEELDIEVETLDSTEGLRAVGRARGDRFAEYAPGIRLAAAAAIAPRDQAARVAPPLRAAAAALALVILGWSVYRFWPVVPAGQVAAPPSASRSVEQGTAAAPRTSQAPQEASPRAIPRESAPTPDKLLPPPGDDVRPGLPSSAASASQPTSTTGQIPAPSPAGQVSSRSPAMEKVPPVEQPPGPATQKSAPAQTTSLPTSSAPPMAQPTPAAPVSAQPPRRAAESPRVEKGPVPLKDPLPRIDSILIDRGRRLAIIDGAILKVGDLVGPRVIVRIDADAVVLREPSGLHVSVRLGPSGQM
jgi:hypothetical protein